MDDYELVPRSTGTRFFLLLILEKAWQILGIIAIFVELYVMFQILGSFMYSTNKYIRNREITAREIIL